MASRGKSATEAASPPPRANALRIVVNARANGLLCAPCVAGLTISSRASLSVFAAASFAARPTHADPSPHHSHRAAAERSARRSSQSFVSEIFAVSASVAAVTCPAATSVASVASEPPSRSKRACSALRPAAARNAWESTTEGASTVSARTRLAKSAPCARGRSASSGSASIAETRQSATSPHITCTPSAKDGSHRRRRANSLVTSSGNNRRTRVATTSGIGADVSSRGGVTSSSKCACWCTKHVRTCETCSNAAGGAMPPGASAIWRMARNRFPEER